MHSITTTDLARALGDAHRTEMGAVYGDAHHNSGRIRQTIGLGLIHAGLRMLRGPLEVHWTHVET